MKSHCVLVLRHFSFEDHRDWQFGVTLALSLSLALSITTNISIVEQQFSFLNVQIFINYQNVNFRDQKQMQITKCFFLSFWTRNINWERLLLPMRCVGVYFPLCVSVCTKCHLSNWSKIQYETFYLYGYRYSYTIQYHHFVTPPPRKINKNSWYHFTLLLLQCINLHINCWKSTVPVKYCAQTY